MIQTIKILPGITLRCIPDHRFKHGCLSLQILRPMDRQEAAMNALLPAVLLRGRTFTLRSGPQAGRPYAAPRGPAHPAAPV